jgi:hypothetical protein
MEMVLILFYSEELQRTIIDVVRTTGQLRSQLQDKPELDVLPADVSKAYLKARKHLVKDGALTDAEAREIGQLTEYRNVVAHEMHLIVRDLSSNRYIVERNSWDPERPRHDPKALAELKRYLRLVDERTQSYITTMDSTRWEFEAAERLYEDDIKRLRSKISKQMAERRKLYDRLDAECDLSGLGFTGDRHPRRSAMKYEDGRLTERGVENLYRLFDAGRSVEAAVIVMDITPAAVKRRRASWVKQGGSQRLIPDFDLLPKRRRPVRYDD